MIYFNILKLMSLFVMYMMATFKRKSRAQLVSNNSANVFSMFLLFYPLINGFTVVLIFRQKVIIALVSLLLVGILR